MSVTLVFGSPFAYHIETIDPSVQKGKMSIQANISHQNGDKIRPDGSIAVFSTGFMPLLLPLSLKASSDYFTFLQHYSSNVVL
jgi:hypothetical protein